MGHRSVVAAPIPGAIGEGRGAEVQVDGRQHRAKCSPRTMKEGRGRGGGEGQKENYSHASSR